MDGILDTFMNVIVFVFTGVMIWLYFKEFPENHDSSDQKTRKKE